MGAAATAPAWAAAAIWLPSGPTSAPSAAGPTTKAPGFAGPIKVAPSPKMEAWL